MNLNDPLLIVQSLFHTKNNSKLQTITVSVAVFCEGKCQLPLGEETHYVIKIERNGQGKMKKTKPEAIAMSTQYRTRGV